MTTVSHAPQQASTTAPWHGAVQRSYSAPVMRQTQTLIGVVLLAGVAAAYFVGPLWLILPAIVGLGLVVAGLTGVCPMALAVGKLPWNRRTPLARDPAGPSCCAR